MSKLMLVVCGVLAFSASAFAAKDPALFGRWLSSPQDVGGGLSVQVALSFAPSGVTATSICTRGSTRAEASAAADFETSGNILRVLGNAQSSTTVDGVECWASVQADSAEYAIYGIQLVIGRNGEQLLLVKSN